MKSFKAYAKDSDKQKPIEKFEEYQLIDRLIERYPAPQYAFLPQVRNSTGYSMRRQIRTADALALSLWASRGLEMHGFEIKTFRADWINELKNPEKAEDIARFCHRWWIVAPDNLVREGELPANWGLLVAKGKGLVCKKEAPQLKAKPIDYAMLAGIMRKANEVMVPLHKIEARIDEAYQNGLNSQKEISEMRTREADGLRKCIEEFEAASGINIRSRWSWAHPPEEVGRIVRFLLDKGPEGVRKQMQTTKESLLRIVRSIDAEEPKLDSKEESL